MKWLRRIGLALAALVGLVLVAALALYIVGGVKLGRTVTADAHPVALPEDSLSLAEGARYTRVFLCVDCHGARLEGTVMIDDPLLGRLVAPHIAPGDGSVTTGFETVDWVRAIRHGIGGDGRPLVIMPSTDYARVMSDEDLSRIIAYVRQAPPVDHRPGKSSLRLAQVMLGAGLVGFEYDRIDHAQRARAKPPAHDTLATGAYYTQICQACHGDDLMGNEEFGGTPLARGGMLEPYDEASFRAFFQSGTTPAGRMIDPEKMPWKTLAAMTDDELRAVWAYLRTVPATFH